jgi:hypothetical protein
MLTPNGHVNNTKNQAKGFTQVSAPKGHNGRHPSVRAQGATSNGEHRCLPAAWAKHSQIQTFVWLVSITDWKSHDDSVTELAQSLHPLKGSFERHIKKEADSA